MSITITEICQAIETTLKTAAGMTYSQTIADITEGMNDYPTIQVYWDELNQDATTTNDRTTFRAGSRQTNIIVFADLYAEPRSHIGQNMSKTTVLVDAIQNVLEQQDTKPYFGLEGIKGFAWSAKRAVFEYAKTLFEGARFTITVRVF